MTAERPRVQQSSFSDAAVRLSDGSLLIANVHISGGELPQSGDNRFYYFVNCALNGVDFSDRAFRAHFVNCHLTGCDFSRSSCLFVMGRPDLVKPHIGCFHPYDAEVVQGDVGDVFCPNQLQSCSFTDAYLRRVAFHGVRIVDCDFKGADLADAFGFQPDSCFVDGARLPLPRGQRDVGFPSLRQQLLYLVRDYFGDRSYRWGVLLQTYTGPSFLLILLLSLIYLLPPAIAVSFAQLVPFEQLSRAESEYAGSMQFTSLAAVLVSWKGTLTFEVFLRGTLWVYVAVRAFQTFYVSHCAHIQRLCGITPSWRAMAAMWSFHRGLRAWTLIIYPYLIYVYVSLLFSRIPVPALSALSQSASQ